MLKNSMWNCPAPIIFSLDNNSTISRQHDIFIFWLTFRLQNLRIHVSGVHKYFQVTFSSKISVSSWNFALAT